MSNKDFPDVSSKSTKNDILDAYNKLLSQIREGNQSKIADLKTKNDEQSIKKVSDLSGDKISKNILELKLSISQELEALEQKVLNQHKNFIDLQNAVKIESQNLYDLYEIKKNTDSLAALLLAHKEYKKKIDEEKEQLKKDLDFEIAEIKTNWLREKEEYEYNLKIARKKDKDSYEEKRQSLEKELVEMKHKSYKEINERETSLKLKEEEFKNLQEKVKLFPKDLETAIKDTEKQTRELIESRYKHEFDLMSKDAELNNKLNNQIISSLQNKINDQDELIKQLSVKATDATKQVQSIAIKALDSSASRFYNIDDIKKSSSQSSSL